MITENQAKALAVILHEIRPRWSTPAMFKLLEKNAQHPAPFADITVAAVNAARDPKVETPGGFLTDQRFWPAESKQLMPKPPPCPDHIGEPQHACRCCKADFLAGIRPEAMIGRHYEPESEDHNDPPASP